ncbi:hypothetical protein FB2170_08874 [Maribacter sp. HTCC2170]|nr:hypothetical protein FB2170_08874 [Maribacter sp. HTCC2170]
MTFIYPKKVTGSSQRSIILKGVIVAKVAVGIALMAMTQKQIRNEFWGIRHDF